MLLCYALDRLSRNQSHIGILGDEILGCGARLDFVTEVFEDSATGRFIRSAKGFAAELQWEKTRWLTTLRIRARVEGAKDGVKRPIAGKKPPYGYVWADARKSTLTIKPEAAAIDRRIFQEAANDSAMLAIADGLTADGIPTPTGLEKPWHQRTIDVILSQTAYIGEMRSYRHEVETSKHQTTKSGKRKRTVTKRPLSETVLIEGAAPVIDRTVYQLAQE